nr:MAG TPA: hypothetical protein [Caudoviricetes sp.]
MYGYIRLPPLYLYSGISFGRKTVQKSIRKVLTWNAMRAII